MLGTLRDLAARLQSGETTSSELVRACLARIAARDPSHTVFLEVFKDAQQQADHVDQQRASGTPVPLFAGIPISVKALFDVPGHTTTAGSRVLKEQAPAQQDARAIARLKQAGFIVIGATNMTEFAYSGLGMNPHYGTPPNALDANRIPGGSSSGAAVAVAQGMCAASIGTDTGGSCRIPAAFNGLVGFKPTASRVPMEGVFPLSPSLDSVGPLAATVECCAILDAVMSGNETVSQSPVKINGLRLGVLRTVVFDDAEAVITSSFGAAIDQLICAGADVIDVEIASLEDLAKVSNSGGVVAHEAFKLHQDLIALSASQYDPRVLSRIEKGRHQTAAQLDAYLNVRRAVIDELSLCARDVDAIVYPTTPITAPTCQSLDDDDAYNRANLLCLRNPTVANLADGCSLSLPIKAQNGLSAGFCLVQRNGADAHLLSVAKEVERVFTTHDIAFTRVRSLRSQGSRRDILVK